MSTMSPTIFYGPVLDTLNHRTIRVLPHALLAVAGGRIAWLIDHVSLAESPDAIRNAAASKGWRVAGRASDPSDEHHAQLHSLQDGEFLIPGFVDTHTHAPQFPNLGRGQDYELLGWLHKITFPTESRFKDVEYARRTYRSVVRRVLDCGTTTCCYYATLHEESTNMLADIVHELGQRAFVGKCNMDRESPDHYCEPSADQSMSATKGTVAHIRGLKPSVDGQTLVHPILTPRFAISCTPKLLASLGDLAKQDPALAIQTHISENPSEVAVVKSLFPDCSTYAHVYESYGLLRENTVLAHGCHLDSHLLDPGADEEAISNSELELIKSRKAGLSHCPTSNLNLRSGVARVGEWLDRGLKVSLGTDVSGGYSPSMLAAVRHASFCSKLIAMEHARKSVPLNAIPEQPTGHHPPLAHRQLPLETLLFLATLGGAQVCNIDNQVGNFVPGKSFDAILVSMRPETKNPNVWVEEHELRLEGEETASQGLEVLLEKFLLCGDDRNIQRVFVAGIMVGGVDHN